MASVAPSRAQEAKAKRTALMAVGIVLFMTALAFASVPLYRLFCQVTGFAGTPQRAETAMENAQLFSHLMGLPEPQSTIVPVLVGSEAAAIAAAKYLETQGFLVVAIRPPTVPEGSSRLRFTFSANHKNSDIERLAEAMKNADIGI